MGEAVRPAYVSSNTNTWIVMQRSTEEGAVKLIGSISVLGPQNEWKRIKSLIEIALADYAEEHAVVIANATISEACKEARAEGFEEGVNSVKDNQYKNEILEEAASVLEGDVLESPDEFEGKTKLKVFDLLEKC